LIFLNVKVFNDHSRHLSRVLLRWLKRVEAKQFSQNFDLPPLNWVGWTFLIYFQ
jgi:hypothetical protein